MKRFLVSMQNNNLKQSSVFWLVLILITLYASGKTAHAGTKYIQLHVGSVKALHVGEVERIAVGNDKILGTTVLENGELLLIPKTSGETDLQIWKPGERKLHYRVTILQENIFKKISVVKSLLRSFGDLDVRSRGDIIIVEGTIAPSDMERFETVASTIPNLVSLVKPKKFLPEKMVKIRLHVIEIDKKFKKELGIKWGDSLNGPVVGVASSWVQNGVYQIFPSDGAVDWNGALAGVGVTDPFVYPYVGFAGSLASRIQLIEENGAGRTLAEPTLVTRSGESASFHSGGEFPVVFTSALGEPRITFKQYGILLDVEPVIDDSDNILVKIKSEVSSLDFSSAVNGMPGVLTRNTDSVINVKNGETIILSGLLSVFDSKSLKKVPLLGNIPLIGKLFRSKAVMENRKELLVMVTPEIVEPGDENSQPDELMTRHLEELREIKSGYIDDELLD